jgi:hypothetical protein
MRARRGLYKVLVGKPEGDHVGRPSVDYAIMTLSDKSATHLNKLRVKDVIILSFLGSFAKLRKAILASSCISVHLSILIEQLGSRWTEFT